MTTPEFDVVVVGAGAAGMSAALTAATRVPLLPSRTTSSWAAGGQGWSDATARQGVCPYAYSMARIPPQDWP